MEYLEELLKDWDVSIEWDGTCYVLTVTRQVLDWEPDTRTYREKDLTTVISQAWTDEHV